MSIIKKIDDSEAFKGFVSPVCSFCKNWHYFKDSCEAFKKIPSEIWEGKNNHKKPFKNDQGIMFEPDND